jgi:hypothetical protein
MSGEKTIQIGADADLHALWGSVRPPIVYPVGSKRAEVLNDVVRQEGVLGTVDEGESS